MLEHALVLLHASPTQSLPTELEVIREVADARLTTVPCFRKQWRHMVHVILVILRGDELGAENSIFREVSRLVREDLTIFRQKEKLLKIA